MRQRMIYSCQSMALRSSGHRKTPLGTKKLAGAISLPSPQHEDKATCGNQCSVDTCCLTCLHQALPPALWQSHFYQSCLSPSTAATPTPTLRRRAQTSPALCLQTCLLQDLCSGSNGGGSHFTGRLVHTFLKCAPPSRNQTRPTTGKGSFCR